MMLKFFIILATVVVYVVCSNKKLVCYWGSWSARRSAVGTFNITNIDPFLCTHLIYAFVGITETHELKTNLTSAGKNDYILFNALRDKNKDLQTMVALGGRHLGSALFFKMVSSAKLRQIFIESTVKFLKTYKFNGLDFYWEYLAQRDVSTPSDRDKFVLCLKELKERFIKENLILSVATPSAEPIAKKSYNILELSKYVDFINLIAYDMHIPKDNRTGLNAPLYAGSSEKSEERKLNVNSSVHYWLSQGAPKEKLILGMPLYGRTFTLVDPKNNGIGAVTAGPGMAGRYTKETGALGFYEICDMQNKKNLLTIFSIEQRVPYIIDYNQWISYDNEQSVREKANFVKEIDLGGAMVWSIETDDFRNICYLGVNPLLNALKSVLRSS